MKISSKVFFFFLLLSPAALAYDLEGKVRLDPPFPEPEHLEIPREHAADCGPSIISPKLRVSPEGDVANAVVKIVGEFPEMKIVPPAGQFTLDQTGCEFSPHVLLIPQGEELSILNSDDMLHNVRAFDEKIGMLFNDAMPKKGQVLKKRFEKSGRLIFRCGVHHWMHAVVVVQEHPYFALTDEKGYFKIEGIPEGDYKLSVWHESLGEIKVEVGPDTGFLTLTYEGGKASNRSRPR